MEKKYEDLGYAKLDTDRAQRCGFPEVVFCQSKTKEQLAEIYQHLYAEHGTAFGTRATQEQAAFVQAAFGPDAAVQYDPLSRILKVDAAEKENASAKRPAAEKEPRRGIVVCSAGTADLPVAEEAAQTAEYFGAFVTRVYDVGVSGIHRLLAHTEVLQDASCIVAVAGMEGALASVIGGLVSCPVIAVPTSVGYGASFEGLSALLTMINSCANGIAVVNIDNGYGAGYIATQIDRQTFRPQ